MTATQNHSTLTWHTRRLLKTTKPSGPQDVDDRGMMIFWPLGSPHRPFVFCVFIPCNHPMPWDDLEGPWDDHPIKANHPILMHMPAWLLHPQNL